MYAIMADTTSDVSHKDRLALACKYVSSSDQPTERLISLGEVKDKRGEGGATEIINTLNNLQVSTDVCAFKAMNMLLPCLESLTVLRGNSRISLIELCHIFLVWHIEPTPQ